MKNLLLIDGHSMAYRAFHALPVDNFATTTGQHTNAVYGFTSMLINLLRDENPSHIAVAFDLSRKSFRTESYPEYKATRSKSPEEFRGQVELIKDVLTALNIPFVTKENYEADDIIATLSTEAAAEGMQVSIVSGDRDAMQLVNDSVTVLYPMKGVSELARMTPDAVEKKYLVPPARYPELAALVGETSDNLPGVPGVGPKTAAKWLAEYDGLDNLITRAEQVRGKAGENFRAHLDDVKRNRRLNALVRDLELDVTPASLERVDWEQEKVGEIFDALEFRALSSRLQELGGVADEPTTDAAGFEVEGQTLEAGEVSAWLAARGDSALGIQFLGTWGAGTGDLRGIALSDDDGKAAYIDASALSPEDEKALSEWLASSAPKIGHDVKGPSHAIAARGWELAGVTFDTMLAAYLLHPEQRNYGLDALVTRYLKRELKPSVADDSPQLALDFGDGEDAQDAMLHAYAITQLARELREALGDGDQDKLLMELEMPLMGVLAQMERVGIAVDLERLQQLRDEFDRAVESAQQSAFDAIGHEVNLGSPKQLQAVLFDELDMPKTRKTKSGYTTDAEALAKLYEQTQHPFLEHLLAHRDQIKLRQTVDGLLAAVGDDGRIHTTYMQTIAATGRLSSTDPNLQNIPIRTALGRRIRSAFVPGKGYESLMSADYSQIEMRLMAHASGDEGLIAAFESGRDFHNEMAAKVFGVTPDEVSGEMRAKIKAMNYGLAYGLSAYGLSNQLKISVGEAKSLMEDYFERVGGVQEYLAGIVEEARKRGYTETMLGRRRYLPDLTSSNRQRREMAERAALNAPIQGSAADVIKVAMLKVEEALEGMESRVLLQVHDELVLEVAEGERVQVAEAVRAAMASAADLRVALEVSVGVGDSWESAAH